MWVVPHNFLVLILVDMGDLEHKLIFVMTVLISYSALLSQYLKNINGQVEYYLLQAQSTTI